MKRYKSLLFGILFGITAVTSPIANVSAASTQTPITRTQAEQRASNMINLTWIYSNTQNGTLSSNYTPLVTQPSQFANLTTAQVTGIPYDWGGGDGLDSTSIGAPWTNFLDAISKGAYAGNVNITAGQQYVPTTAGIDCSGFVQGTFNIRDYKISTSTMFDKYFTKINLSDIKHMDILDRPGDHVVIFDKWGTLNGVQGAFTYESTPDQVFGGIQGTKQYFLTMDDLNDGYIAGRYVNIVEDSVNTPTVPHPIDAGVFAQITNVTNYANLRSTPSTSANMVGSIPKGTVVYLISYSNGWYQLKYNGQVAWVYGTLISPINSGKYVTVNGTTYQVNIRNNPSATSSNIIGVLTQGQYSEVIDYSSDGKWMKISVNGVQGWSSSSYLSYIN